MKKLEAVILGYGDRSSRYADYAISRPDELKITGVIDINPLKREQAAKKFNLPESMLFKSLDDFLSAKILCDFVINGTMDSLHYQTVIPLLKAKYNVLLEKPITSNLEELLEIKSEAKKNGCKLVICHVLRYTPFYSEIKRILNSGIIGEIVDMQLNEHCWYGHFVNAYVRGKWRSEKESGSGFLLAKSCHDLDLMCWLNNISAPEEVSSFGGKAFFTLKNAPENSTDFCYNCPAKNDCMFDAEKFHIEKDFIPFYTWAEINKPLGDITLQEKREFLKHNVYGRCVYKTDMDIVDRQCVSVKYKNGSIGTFNLVGGTSKAGRHIHIICTLGEIVGYIEENNFLLRVFDKKKINYTEKLIDLNKNVINSETENSVAGHYGGDFLLMHDLVRYINGEQTSVSTTTIDDSIYSHVCCYAAEKSRNEKVIVNVDDYQNTVKF